MSAVLHPTIVSFHVRPVDLVWFAEAAAGLGLPVDAAALAHDAAARYARLLCDAANDWTPVHDDRGNLVAWLDDNGVRPVTVGQLRARAIDEAAENRGVTVDQSPYAHAVA